MTGANEHLCQNIIFVPELSPPHNRTAGPLGKPEEATVPVLLIKHQSRCADYQTGAVFFWGFFCAFLPVLSTFLMTTATCPFSMELSSLTMRMRQVQRTSRDRARRMRPTARSGKLAFANMCLPVMDKSKR